MFSTSALSVRQGLRRMRIGVEDNPIWRRFRRNVSISVMGSGLSLGVKLGQTALLTRLLKIEDYGRLLIVLNLFVFLDSFFGVRVNDVMFRFFPQFKEQKNALALKGLLLLCLGICLVFGLLIYGGVVALSPWLAQRLYPNLELAPLFNIYGCTIVVSAFSGVYEPILRLHDRFTAIVVPQVLGSLVTLAMLSVYFTTTLTPNISPGVHASLTVVIVAFTVGALIQSLSPMIQAMRLIRPLLANLRLKESAHALAAYRRAIAACFVNSNLSGYLKFAISPGDVFLMGLFSSPTQLALYGLAKQLSAPLALLQTNMQTAVIPEITLLAAKRNFEQLRRLLGRYVWWTTALGSLFLISAFFLGRLLILKYLRPEYLAALPVFYVLLIAGWLMLVLLVFRPLAVSLDLLRWHNLTLLASSAIVAFFIVIGGLNALTMACIQLTEVLVLRSLVSMLVWRRLRRIANKV
jgi:O-antigen/teichoic acid export membrane protein